MRKYGYFFEAVSAYIRLKKPLENVNFHQVGSFEVLPYTNFLKKYIGHLEFIARRHWRSSKILGKEKIDVIHHMLPAVYNQSFNPLAFSRKRKYPFIFGPISAHLYPRPSDEKAFMRLTSKLHMETVRRSDRLIAITSHVKKLYSKIVEDEKIWVIPLGVDTDLFKPLEERENKDGFEILFVGHLYRLKGVENLLRAMSLISKERGDAKLRIVGDGPDKSRLMNLAKALRLEAKTFFEGLISHAQIAAYYQRCDVLCFPTLGEPFGKVILEAMACGKPVVASNIGGPTHIIKEGKTGFLVPPGQPKAIAERILELLNDESRMKEMGRNARRVVVRRYSWDKIAEAYHKLYNSLL